MGKASLKPKIREMEQWLSKPSNRAFLFEDPRRRIEGWLRDAEQHSLRFDVTMCLKLRDLATWHGVSGTCSVLNGDPSGWDQVHASFLYRGWSRRLVGALRENGQYAGSVFLWEVALVLTHAIAFSEDSFADWLGSDLVTSFAARDGKYEGWKKTPFEPFAVKLYALWRNLGFALSSPDVCTLPAYEDLLIHWQEPARFLIALRGACDYHVKRSVDRGGDPEFIWAPYDVFPVEILAIKRIRACQALPMPKIDHPIMDTPLASVPHRRMNFHDELLDRLVERARKELPIGHPW
jgi:hypothetical protein